jgi:hypothetical protein
MATEPGFPWQAPSRDPEKEGVTIPDPKAQAIRAEDQEREAVATSPVKATAAAHDTQPRKHSNSTHGRSHRGSVKGPPKVNYSIPVPPPDLSNSKPTSPLPVRTIPRKSWLDTK